MAVGSDATILYTDDYGDYWHIIYSPGGIYKSRDLYAVHFVDSNTGYACGEKTIIVKTTNGGLSWTDISPDRGRNLNDIAFTDPLNGFSVGNYGLVLKTINGGQTWDTVNLGTNNGLLQICFANQYKGFITGYLYDKYLQTDDGGNNWDTVRVKPVIENFYVNNIFFINQDTGFLGGAADQGGYRYHYVLKTIDGGTSWYQVNLSNSNYSKYFCFPNADTGFSLGPVDWYSNNLLRTTDGGETWQEYSNNFGDWFLKGICMSETGIGFIVGGQGQIFKSNDWGTNWDTAFTNLAPRVNFMDAQLISDSIIYAGGYFIVGGGVLKSYDLGNTWNSIYNSSFISSIHFLTSNYGFICGADQDHPEVYRTFDGGETWSYHFITYDEFSPQCLWFIDSLTGFVGGQFYYPDSASIYKSTDAGESWYHVQIMGSNDYYGICDMEFINESKGFAVGGGLYRNLGKVLMTTDRGEHWYEILYFPNRSLNHIHFINGLTGFAVGYNLILKTTDGGNTWEEIPSGVSGSMNFTYVDFPSPETGYITGTGNEISILKSDDGGESWDPILSPCTSDMLTLCFFTPDEGLVLGANATIFKTYTGGMVDVPEIPEVKAENGINIFCMPNPASEISEIRYQISDVRYVSVKVFDIHGKLVTTLVSQEKERGEHSVSFDTSGLATGVYFIRIWAGKKTRVFKIVKVDG
jgi:photosystem II stability/assembly factor-like uncharacterized protein